MNYLCIRARRRSFTLTALASVIVEGGVKQSHWIAIAFWRLCSRCCSATSDDLSYLPSLISRDLDRTLFKKIITECVSYILEITQFTFFLVQWFIKNNLLKKYLSIISSKVPFESSPGENGKYSMAERKILCLTCKLLKGKRTLL